MPHQIRDQGLMAANAGRMSSRPSPPPAAILPVCSELSSEEENLAFSLMLLASGIREQHPAFPYHAATPPSPLPPPHVAHVPAGVAHGLAQDAPAAEETSQTPASAVVVPPSPRQGPTQVRPPLVVVPPRQGPTQVRPPSLLPVVAVRPNPVLEQVIPPPNQPPNLVIVTQQSPAPALASTQHQAAPSLVATTNNTPFNNTTTVPAMVENQTPAPQQELLHECPACLKRFKKARGLNVHMKSHPDGRRHPCVFCMSTFPSSSALRSHVRCSRTCGGNKPRKLGPVAAAAIAWHTIDLNMPEI